MALAFVYTNDKAMNLENAYPRPKRPEKKKDSPILVAFVWIICGGIALMLTIPNLLGGHANSKGSSAKADISELSAAIDQFKLDCDRYPTTKEGLGALTRRPKGASGWSGPYLRQQIPSDSWGNPYIYTCPGPSGKGYQVESYGADGQPGGEDDNADIIGGSDT